MWPRTLAATLLLLALAAPATAYAAPSVEASPVVTVAGSQVEATATLTTTTVDAIGSAVAGALAEALPDVQSVAVTESESDRYFRQVEHGALWAIVFLLAVIAGLRLVNG